MYTPSFCACASLYAHLLLKITKIYLNRCQIQWKLKYLCLCVCIYVYMYVCMYVS